MRFEEVTAKIPVHPQAEEKPEDFRERLQYQLGFLLMEKMERAYGSILSTEPSNVGEYFIMGFNDVTLKMQVPVFTGEEIAALRKDPELIERAIDEGEVVIP